MPAPCLRIWRLNDEVDVDPLHREVDHAVPKPLAAALERPSEALISDVLGSRASTPTRWRSGRARPSPLAWAVEMALPVVL